MRILTFLALMVVACGIAGLYGALHDQISYTVSPEYFTKFKYYQFGLEHSELPDRIKASWIGFLGSWWMGLYIGTLVGGVGFIHATPSSMWSCTLKAYAAVALTAFLIGLAGLGYGSFFADPNPEQYTQWYIPEDLTQPARFLSVGYMHNSSYLGGAIGILVGVITQVALHLSNLRKSI